MFKLDFRKSEEPEIKLLTSIGSSKSKRGPEITYFCFTDDATVFDCVDHFLKNVENSLRDGTARPPYLPPEESAGQE